MQWCKHAEYSLQLVTSTKKISFAPQVLSHNQLNANGAEPTSLVEYQWHREEGCAGGGSAPFAAR